MTYSLPKVQLAVLRGVAAGMRQEDIAREHHITVDTVKTHLRALYHSMGARNAPHAVSIGYQLGILAPPREDCCRASLERWLVERAREVRDG